MQKEYRVGIEFEYWLTQYRNKSAAGIKSFDNITLSELAPALNNRPGWMMPRCIRVMRD